jgi:uncharacterized membrane protein
MEVIDTIMHALRSVASVISVVSVAVVVYGTVIAIAKFVLNECMRFGGRFSIHQLRVLRANFGTYLLFALELLIASDIMKTIVEPGVQELMILGGIVVLRTALSFFLDREIRLLDQEAKDLPAGSTDR